MAGLEAARSALARIDEWVARLEEHTAGAALVDAGELPIGIEAFFAALDDDLNISGAMGQLFDLIRDTNKSLDAGTLDATAAAAVLAGWRRINTVLAFDREAAAIPSQVQGLVNLREQARAEKNWAESDRLRDEIAALGWTVKDTKEGPKLTPR
jgi:cysteinyl-tRNA synthetase